MCSKENKCFICNKFYSSYKSWWNHNKQFHKNNDTDDVNIPVNNVNIPVNNVNIPVNNVNIPVNNVDINVHNINDNVNNKKIIKCEYCNKIYASRFSKSNHKKNCKFKNNIIQPITESTELIKLKKENEEFKNTILNILQQAKIHPKTLQKINKQLINNNSNNTINTNNGTIINNTYVKFGSVPHSSVLKESAILNILNRPFESLEESIKSIHFNKDLPEYNNIYITNMKDNLAYIFNGKQFISVRKNDILDELIDNHKDQIENSFEEFKNKLSDFRIKRIEAFLDLINNDEERYIDGHNRTYTNYKVYKMEDIKMLLYNLTDAKKLEILKTIDFNEIINNNEIN